jgi:hypothetical protein
LFVQPSKQQRAFTQVQRPPESTMLDIMGHVSQPWFAALFPHPSVRRRGEERKFFAIIAWARSSGG